MVFWFCWLVLLAGRMEASAREPAVDPSRPSAKRSSMSQRPDYEEYLQFFEKVYDTVDQNYYFPVSRASYERFLSVFDQKIYPQLRSAGKTVNFIKWRSSAYLVDFLKSKEDIFSAFYPPKAAKEYEETALGKRVDLGIEGELTTEGFAVSRVEPRSDAHAQGLRAQDTILQIDEQSVLELTQAKIEELLNPVENTTVRLTYLGFSDRRQKTIAVVSQEYFKQLVFRVPVDVPGVACLQIQRFNQKTADDMTELITQLLQENLTGLIIDLRGNPGGPPLAAQQISAFFLPPKEEFAYFQKKNRPKSSLDVPEIPAAYRFPGQMVILVNEKSGSASELFTGILQRRGRATVMGINTAGQVFLKSMFHFDDESMVLLVTARGHYPDGEVFSFQGLIPDEEISAGDVDLLRHAAEYLQRLPLTPPTVKPL